MTKVRTNTRGSITLGDLWSRVAMLEIACQRCDRHGRLSLARLVAEHGEGMGLPAAVQDAPMHVYTEGLKGMPGVGVVLSGGGVHLRRVHDEAGAYGALESARC